MKHRSAPAHARDQPGKQPAVDNNVFHATKHVPPDNFNFKIACNVWCLLTLTFDCKQCIFCQVWRSYVLTDLFNNAFITPTKCFSIEVGYSSNEILDNEYLKNAFRLLSTCNKYKINLVLCTWATKWVTRNTGAVGLL